MLEPRYASEPTLTLNSSASHPNVYQTVDHTAISLHPTKSELGRVYDQIQEESEMLPKDEVKRIKGLGAHAVPRDLLPFFVRICFPSYHPSSFHGVTGTN